MNRIREIIRSSQKPKEKVVIAADLIKQNVIQFQELIAILRTGSDVEKGTCADIMKHVTAEMPEIAEPYVDDIIGYINYKAPRVKWGISESIGNIAKKNPQVVEKATPFLLMNTVENKENSTVIRWCAAFALSEIAKASKDVELTEKIGEIAEKEKNNGVRNVYLKAIKKIRRIL